MKRIHKARVDAYTKSLSRSWTRSSCSNLYFLTSISGSLSWSKPWSGSWDGHYVVSCCWKRSRFSSLNTTLDLII